MLYKDYEIIVKTLKPKYFYSCFQTKNYTWLSQPFLSENQAIAAAKLEIDRMIEI